MEEARICSCCGRELSIAEFSGRGVSYRKMCKACANIYDAEKKRSNATPEKQLILKTLIGMAEDKGLISGQQAYDRYIELYPEDKGMFVRPGDETEAPEEPVDMKKNPAAYVNEEEEKAMEKKCKMSKQTLAGMIIGQFMNNLEYIFKLWYDGERENLAGLNRKLANKMFDLLDKAYNTKEEAIQEFGQQITELRNDNEELRKANQGFFEQNQSLFAKIDELTKAAKPKVKTIEDYTPRELMQELYRRGYRGVIEYEVREIRKCKLEA